jgi:hypothetical protein
MIGITASSKIKMLTVAIATAQQLDSLIHPGVQDLLKHHSAGNWSVCVNFQFGI